MRPVVQAILAELLARHAEGGHVHLDDLAEVIAARPVTPEEIEAIIDRLEAAGRRVGEPLDERDIAVVSQVLDAARRLRAALGRRPTVDEIASDTGQPPHAVRRALEHAARAGKTRGPATS